ILSGDYQKAEISMLKASVILKHLNAELPHSFEIRWYLAGCYAGFGEIFRLAGRYSEVYDVTERRVQILRELAEELPRSDEIREELMRSEVLLHELDARRGRNVDDRSEEVPKLD